MDNPGANKTHIPCQAWADQNGWSTASAQGSLFDPLPSSQHFSLGLSPGQRPSYDHLQASSQSCMIGVSSSSSSQHSALFKASQSSSSSTAHFANTAIRSSSRSNSFVQPSPHTSSVLLSANQEKNIPSLSLPPSNQALPPCRPQQMPLLSAHNTYNAIFNNPEISQPLSHGLQDMPVTLPSCGQQGVPVSPATPGGVNEEFSGNIQSHCSVTSREQCQWRPSSHCRGKLPLQCFYVIMVVLSCMWIWGSSVWSECP